MNPPIIDTDFYMQASFNQYCAYTAWLRIEENFKWLSETQNVWWRQSHLEEIERLERASWMHLFIHEERISL